MRSAVTRSSALIAAAALTIGTMAACSTNKDVSTTTATSNAAAASLSGSIAFNDDKLAELRDKIKSALAGKSLSAVDDAVVVNVTAAYWTAARTGTEKAAQELGVKATFQEPSQQDITQQLSIVNTLLSQGVTGMSISAIQPSSVAGAISTATKQGTTILGIDSPLTDYKSEVPLYLGTPNYEAGQNAGNAMKKLLPNGGDVAIMVGSLTALNAVQRIAGFKAALQGSNVKVFQTYNDNGDADKALQNANAAFQADPNIKGLYGVYSYDGPGVAQAVQSAGKTGKVVVVADDSEPKTLSFLKSGVIQATVLQQPYQQGYMSVYLLTAFKVLGASATMALIKPYLDSDGYTLSSGVGLVTQSNLASYQAKLASFGISSS